MPPRGKSYGRMVSSLHQPVADHGFTALAVACQNNNASAAKALLACTHCYTGLPNNNVGAAKALLACTRCNTGRPNNNVGATSTHCYTGLPNNSGATPLFLAAEQGWGYKGLHVPRLKWEAPCGPFQLRAGRTQTSTALSCRRP